MLNLIHQPKQYSGASERTEEFCSFLSSHGIKYEMNGEIIKDKMNVIMSIPDLYAFLKLKGSEGLLPFCYIVASNLQFGLQYVDLIKAFNQSKGIWIHNAYLQKILSKHWDCSFVPMFNFNTPLPSTTETKKYKYGFYHSVSSDVNTSHIISRGHPFFTPDNTLVLCSENLDGWDTVSNDYQFFGSVDKIIEFSSKYSSRHVCSKFLLKAISLEKKISLHLVGEGAPSNIVMFKQCAHIDLLPSQEEPRTLDIKYASCFFRTTSYTEHLLNKVLLEERDYTPTGKMEDYTDE